MAVKNYVDLHVRVLGTEADSKLATYESRLKRLVSDQYTIRVKWGTESQNALNNSLRAINAMRDAMQETIPIVKLLGETFKAQKVDLNEIARAYTDIASAVGRVKKASEKALKN